MASYVLRCASLSFAYQDRGNSLCALSKVTFEVAHGEFVTLVGPSGCGKTTLLRALAGLLPKTAGSVEFAGGLPGRFPAASLVFQENSLFPWQTVLENAAFGLEMRGIDKSEREYRAAEMLARFGLAGRERNYPHQLSLGMKQRVAVIRAFLSLTPVLLMDEPFAALDVQTRMLAQQQLAELWESERKTVVFVTHDIDEALLLSDRILVLSASPGTVMSEHVVTAARPRSHFWEPDEEMFELKRRIFCELQLESGLAQSACVR